MIDPKDVVTVRLLVGYLGERRQAGWWASEFLGSSSQPFLSPVFGVAAGMAQAAGVTEAARRVHDERIGVGQVFHLFRLPESLEQGCASALRGSPSQFGIKSHLTSSEGAMAALRVYANDQRPSQQGPIRVGSIADLTDEEWLVKAASSYLAAFEQGVQSFPYFADRT